VAGEQENLDSGYSAVETFSAIALFPASRIELLPPQPFPRLFPPFLRIAGMRRGGHSNQPEFVEIFRYADIDI
jgi:hypothetical protein